MKSIFKKNNIIILFTTIFLVNNSMFPSLRQISDDNIKIYKDEIIQTKRKTKYLRYAITTTIGGVISYIFIKNKKNDNLISLDPNQFSSSEVSTLKSVISLHTSGKLALQSEDTLFSKIKNSTSLSSVLSTLSLVILQSCFSSGLDWFFAKGDLSWQWIFENTNIRDSIDSLKKISAALDTDSSILKTVNDVKLDQTKIENTAPHLNDLIMLKTISTAVTEKTLNTEQLKIFKDKFIFAGNSLIESIEKISAFISYNYDELQKDYTKTVKASELEKINQNIKDYTNQFVVEVNGILKNIEINKTLNKNLLSTIIKFTTFLSTLINAACSIK